MATCQSPEILAAAAAGSAIGASGCRRADGDEVHAPEPSAQAAISARPRRDVFIPPSEQPRSRPIVGYSVNGRRTRLISVERSPPVIPSASALFVIPSPSPLFVIPSVTRDLLPSLRVAASARDDKEGRGARDDKEGRGARDDGRTPFD